jgi:uncharacterized protein
VGVAYKIAEFCHVLRGLGIRVSASEMVDASQALLITDWSRPQQVKAMLQATLVKRAIDIPIFQQAFSHFFVDEETKRQYMEDYEERHIATQKELQRANTDLTFQGNSLHVADELKQVYTQIPEKDQERLRDFLHKTSSGHLVEEKFQPIVEKMIIGSLEYWRRQLAENETLFPVALTGDEMIDPIIQTIANHLETSAQSLLHKDMQRISEHEIPVMLKLIKLLTRMLCTQISRRYRHSSHNMKIDVRKTIRFNMRHGGAMFTLKYKTIQKSKPNLLLLCDVSGSMARYVAFVLQFIYGLSHQTWNIESFIFAEDVERMTSHFTKKKPFADTMSQIMVQSAQWGKGTNLRKSLFNLKKQHPKVIQPSTVLVIVSDTKTVQCEYAAKELAELRKKIKGIIWLNTLPETEWPRYKSVAYFQAITRMAPCNTLMDLTKIIRSEIFHI